MHRFILFSFLLIFATHNSAHASHVINNSGKSGKKILVTDMYWTGKSCQKQDLTYEVISGPENGKIIQEKKIEPLDSIKIKAAKINECDGKIIIISYIFYKSNPKFKGEDQFTIMWTSVGEPRPGNTRTVTYHITID
jgi:hypothetical protein